MPPQSQQPERIFVDRSRVIRYQRCPRSRYLEYHEAGTGIVSVKKPLAPYVGISVHAGLAVLLRLGQAAYGTESANAVDTWRDIEGHAVAAALADFAQHSPVLELDMTEQAAMQASTIPKDSALQFDDYLAGSLGMTAAEAGLQSLTERIQAARSEFDRYLVAEQSALVEALVRAYARRRLRPLLEQFVVLEVECEGEWQLGSLGLLCDKCHRPQSEEARAHGFDCYCGGRFVIPAAELWFMSRPDALLLERDSQQLYLLSFKTTGGWDVRKARDAEHDMQGLSEAIEVEKRLGEWWQELDDMDCTYTPGDIDEWAIYKCSQATLDYLEATPAPPRIFAVRYEYLLKGDRWRDKELSAKLGMEVRSQRSHLIRGYYNAQGTGAWNWSWEYLKLDSPGEASKLNRRQWASAPVWETMPIREWIDRLDTAAQAVSGDTGAELGYQSDAQATGYTVEHPLDAVFLAPITVYRNDDDLRDMAEQLEAQETRVAADVARVAAAVDEGERRHLLNVLFPQTRSSCEYPSTCAYCKVCYGGEDIRRDPLGSGLYKRREFNHPQEAHDVHVHSK